MLLMATVTTYVNITTYVSKLCVGLVLHALSIKLVVVGWSACPATEQQMNDMNKNIRLHGT